MNAHLPERRRRLLFAGAAFAAVTTIVGIAIVVTVVGGPGSSSTAPARGTTFERLLRLVPYTSETIASVYLIDYGRAYETMGVKVPSRPLKEEDVAGFNREVVDASVRSGANYSFLVMALGTYTLVGPKTRPARIGYSMAEVRGHVYAGLSPGSVGAEDRTFEAVDGRFDGSAINRALSVCDHCGMDPEFHTHAGVPYVAWGQDLRPHILMRYAAPAFDRSGTGGRVAATDERVVRTNWSEGIEAMIDAEQDNLRSLADDPYFVSVARALDREGAILAQITCQSWSPEAIRNAITGYYPTEEAAMRASEQWAQTSLPLLRPFLLTGTGTGFANGENYVVVVLAHTTEEDARENAGRLRSRLEKGTSRGGEAWANRYSSIDVRAEGSLVIARLAGSFDYHVHYYESLLIREE